MPIYEYECPKCGSFEHVQSITADPLKRCPDCRRKVTKQISRSSFHLKGGGWYADSYKASDKGSGEASDKAAKNGESKAESSEPAAAPGDSSATPKPAKPADSDSKSSAEAASSA